MSLHYIHYELKKGDTILMSITSSDINKLSKFFHMYTRALAAAVSWCRVH